MADVTIASGFGDNSHGTMRAGTFGTGGLRINVWEITGNGDCSSTTSLPTTLSKVMFADAWVDVSAVDASSGVRRCTGYSVCSNGPYVCFSLAEVSSGFEFSSTYLHAMAIGW